MINNLCWDSLETSRIKSSLHMFYKMFNQLPEELIDYNSLESFKHKLNKYYQNCN